MRAAAGGTIALALLACACVFTALAGPAVSLRLRTARVPAGYDPMLEVIYRSQLASHVKTVAGHITAIPPDAIGVTVTEQTAARYGLHTGSRLTLRGPGGPVALLVTAVVRERDPAGTFWTADPLAAAPDLTQNPGTGQSSLEGAILANPGQVAAVQSAFCPALGAICDKLQLDWEYPVITSGVTADQAQAFVNDLATAVDSPFAQMGAAAADLGISVLMISTLHAFITAQGAVLAVLLLLFVSLTVIVVVVILVAARIVVARRDDELAMLRRRGASSRQVALRVLGGAAPAVIVAAAVAGLVVLHDQGVSAAGATNWYLTAAPVLVAVPAAVIAVRLYPLAVRALLPFWRRRGGVASYVGLAGAIERRTATALPAFTLVLALTLAAFGGMVNGTITGGQISYSWQAIGADVVIDTNGPAYDITPAVQKQLSAVPGVRHSAAAWTTTWQLPFGGRQVTVAQVDPAGYAAVTADTPFPHVPASAFGPADAGPVTANTVIAVLASPAAAAALGPGIVQLTSSEPMGPIRIRVAGTVARTPAEPAGGMFVLMPLRTLPGVLGQPTPNLALLTGPHIDRSRLAKLVGKVLPPATVEFRSDVLNGLGSAPLQHAAAVLMTLTAAAAAGLALLNMVFGMALGARDRELTLARLAVLGYARSARLVLLMALPGVLAAFVAAAGCALALPALISPALDLSVFTGPGAPVTYRPDLAALGVPCLVIVALLGAALVAETSRSRRRGVTGLLRMQ